MSQRRHRLLLLAQPRGLGSRGLGFPTRSFSYHCDVDFISPEKETETRVIVASESQLGVI